MITATWPTAALAVGDGLDDACRRRLTHDARPAARAGHPLAVSTDVAPDVAVASRSRRPGRPARRSSTTSTPTMARKPPPTAIAAARARERPRARRLPDERLERRGEDRWRARPGSRRAASRRRCRRTSATSPTATRSRQLHWATRSSQAGTRRGQARGAVRVDDRDGRRRRRRGRSPSPGRRRTGRRPRPARTRRAARSAPSPGGCSRSVRRPRAGRRSPGSTLRIADQHEHRDRPGRARAPRR